jgi:predicted restriction endonuclease
MTMTFNNSDVTKVQCYFRAIRAKGKWTKSSLEAAHILPYSKGGTFSNTNGLLLRSDLHTLFDLGMIAVETAGLTVIVAKQLMETPYNIYHGTKIRLPSELSNRPDIRALDKHRKSAKLH